MKTGVDSAKFDPHDCGILCVCNYKESLRDGDVEKDEWAVQEVLAPPSEFYSYERKVDELLQEFLDMDFYKSKLEEHPSKNICESVPFTAFLCQQYGF